MWWRVLRILIGLALEQNCKQKRWLVENEIPPCWPQQPQDKWDNRVGGRYNYMIIINNYSPKAKWLPVNIHRDEVEVNIRRNHWAWGE
jgi:hypothetical protein